MAKPYFRQVPNFEYVSRVAGEQNISNYVSVKNFFKRGKLREDIFGNLSYFTKYNIIGDERPDNVAYKNYGDSTLDWVVLLSNNILDIQTEWPMTQGLFDEVMLEKYGTYENLYSGIHHYETSEIKNNSGKTILAGGLRISPTWKTNGNFVEIFNSQIAVISSGDSVNPSTTVTVYVVNGIPSLEVGSQVVITNVSENEYNGAQIVTEILSLDGNNVTGFRYELASTPNVASPTLSSLRSESVLFYVSENSTLTANSYYYEYWDESLGYTVYVPASSFVIPVTNYEYEFQEQEKKRSIFLLKPRYLNVVFNDLDDIMPYKKGSEQYVSRTLKRGDNIRLYQ
jgi:hypothetical protein